MNHRNSFIPDSQGITVDRAFWAAIILTSVAAGSVVLSAVLIFRYPAWQVILMGFIALVSMAFDIASIFLIRNGRPALGIKILYWAIIFTLPPYAILFTGITLVLIATELLMGLLVVFLLFPPLWRKYAQLGPILSSGVIFLADIINPTFRYNLSLLPTTNYYSPGVLIFLAAGVFVLLIRQAGIGNIRTKLILVFIVIAVFSVGSVAFFTQQTLRNNLTVNAGNNLVDQAGTRATEIGLAIEHELKLVEVLALNTSLQEAAISYSHALPLSQTEVETLDQQWITAELTNNDNDPLVENIVNNRFSSELRIFRDQFPQHAEVFLTNAQGVNIAATNRTSDYFQADEEWWQTAYREGVYIGQPEYDASTGIVALNMAVALTDGNGRTMGILRSTVNYATLTNSLIAGLFGETGRTFIYMPNGRLLMLQSLGDGLFELGQYTSPPPITAFIQSSEPYQEIYLEKTPSLAGHATISIRGNDASQMAVNSLGWNVITVQSQAEALRTIQELTRNIIFLAIVIVIAVIVAAVILARIFSGPIIRLTTVASAVASGDLAVEANVETRDEIGALATTFNNMTAQLRELIESLEQRVAERTTELETSLSKNQERTGQLEAIADVARSIASLKGAGQLLPEITRTISQRFGFYHVGIFLLDERKEFAELRAANSEGGQKMLARSHKLRVGQQGIVGFSIAQKTARIALDVGEDSVFFDNPDLPTTRSEMALPLIIGDEVIGALDVQSNRPNAFTEEDVQVLATLADQVAIAIENARLFQQSQKSLEELESTFQRYIRNQWQQYSEVSTLKGYRAHETGVEPITESTHEKAKKTKQKNVHKVPVALRGVTIGTLDIDLGKQSSEYSREEIDIIHAAAERVALALEGARLLEESQRSAAKEQVISEITAKVGASVNLRNVLQTAVEELGRVLPGSEVEILLNENKAE